MKLTTLLLVILMGNVFYSCSTAKIYFVRHGEKSLTVKVDPPLSAEGEQRALDLKNLLKNKKIKRIYSTNTLRTISTAKPLATFLSIPIGQYAQDTMPKFLYSLLESGENTLVVGHSNTVLKMVQELELVPSKKEIPDNEYDNLYVVYLKSKNGGGGYVLRLKELKFGKPSLNK
jgi:broad specificity phosphatase PhoE